MRRNGFDRDDVEQALDALASDVPAPSADAATLIARGRRRIVRQRLVVIGLALAVVATAAGVGALTNNNDARRIVAPVPTTSTTPGLGPSRQIAVASPLEAWKCLNPMQYTDNGGRSWKSVALPTRVPADLVSSCTAVAGGNAWADWQDSKNEFHILRIRGGHDPQVFSFPRLPENTGLGPLTFVDRDHGWAQTSTYDSGQPTHLYRTSDGGATWKLATTNVGGGPIAFADLNHGWSSDGANLSYTGDGGVTWRAVALPAPVTTAGPIVLFQVEAHDESIVVWRGIPMDGNRYRPFFDFSTDGGRTWSLRAGPDDFESRGAENNAFDAIAGRSWVMTSGNALRITTDSGEWQTRPDVPAGGYVGGIYFPTSDIGWATTSTGAILRTADSGRTWTDVTNGAAPEPTTRTTNSTPKATQNAAPSPLAFASATEGWICGTRVSYSTHDFDPYRGGTQEVGIPSNASVANGDYPQQPLCTSAPGGNFWLVRGSANESESEIVHTTIRSTGDETSVRPFAPRPSGRIESLDFVDADHGWALVQRDGAPQHDLYSTGDGGATWSILLQGNAPLWGELDFEDSRTGWASGYALPTLATTTDGGHTWRTVAVPTPHGATQFAPVVPALVRGNVVITYGAWDTDTATQLRPFVDVSTDGGRTWSLRPGPEGVTVPGGTATRIFSAADADHWALGFRNHLYVTDNGGRTWTDQEQFAGVRSIFYVARPSATAMFVSGIGDPAGRSTVVLGTINSGDNWITADFGGPPQSASDKTETWPGGIVGCPTRTLTPAEPGDPPPGLVEAAFAYIRAQGFWEPDAASAVYKVGDNSTGVFGELFSFQLRSCPTGSVANSWVVELYGKIGSGGGGSTPSAEVVLAHYADGWHVFGRYH